MIFGVGCDLCAAARIEKSLTGAHGAAFAQKVYGAGERAALGLAAENGAAQDVSQAHGAATRGKAAPNEAAENAPQRFAAYAEKTTAASTEKTAASSLKFSTFSAHTVESAAADFAAKEAFLKAAGTGLSGFAMPQIEALRKPSGAPYYAFSGGAAAWMQKNGLTAQLSLTHENGLAAAFCILEKAEG